MAEPGRDWTVEAMAGLSNMSRASFHKRFAEICGVSPSNFLLQTRMKLATQFIEEGLSLSRAAEKVGYQTDAAFSRVFKKACQGLSSFTSVNIASRGLIVLVFARRTNNIISY